MTQLQKKVLQLLKEIDQLCQANGIEYYLAAGSALGAVRHRGFIPWDDDADICMTHANWKKFYALKQQGQIPEGRALVEAESSFETGYPINRYADLTTTRLYRYLCASPQQAGIIVDILVLDPVPDDPEAIRDYVVNLTDYCSLLIRAAVVTQRCPWPTHFEQVWKLREQLGEEKALAQLKERAEKYTNTSGGVLIQRDPIVPHVWKEACYGKPQYVPFEDTMMPIAAMPFEHLSIAFNEDWMYVPATTEREEHMKGVSMSISNNNAFEDYLTLVDPRQVKELYTTRQYYSNLNGELEKEQDWQRLRMTGAKVKLSYRRRGFDPDALRELLDRGAFEELDAYFAEYATIQGHKSLIGGCAVQNWLRSQQPYYIDLGDAFLYLFLRWQMHYPGVFSKACKILQARERQGELDGPLQELRSLIDRIRQACNLTFAQDYAAAWQIVAPLYPSYPENCALMRLYYALRYFLQSEERGALARELKGLPQDDVLSCIRARILWEQGRRSAALGIYDTLAHTTTHGLVLLHIRELSTSLTPEDALYARACAVSEAAAVKMGTVREDGEDEEESAAEDFNADDNDSDENASEERSDASDSSDAGDNN